jgi:predicted transcriptional regulator
MVRHQVRRLLVLDSNGRLCGVVSVDDLATLADVGREEHTPQPA